MADRPNVIYLHSHDTGRHVQPYGHAVPTPAIQRLAEQGVLFRRAFATTATCSGSRAALVTGQYPHVNGMTGLAHRGWELNDPGEHLVHTLREAGYWSELIGEQHVSETPDVLGYDRFHDIDSNHVATVAPLAIDALQGGMPEPFFLSVGFFETHRRFFEPTSIHDELYALPPANLPDIPEVRRDMAHFLASARSLDDGVGQVLAALERTGLADRTLVILTTDHGLPFPGSKATLFDRGLGVSLILRGPGFTGGHVQEAMVSHLDILPTLCDLAGLPHPAYLQGSSLLPLVGGETDRLHDELFSEITYHAAYEPQRAVRTDRYKLIRRFDSFDGPVLPNTDDGFSKDALLELGWAGWATDEWRLHDLLLDPNEMRNLIAEPAYAGVARDLRRRLARWMQRTDDPLLRGPVALPPRGRANNPGQRSADEPMTELGSALQAAAA
ncbi:MAG: N-sulfoglucosamine sulfohydrolase [Solirubrobacteraceae bacterium]|nr:N-sulfoglucosamine sulfohydrolase [Solirubrobacteraceae bacterium]